MTVEHWRMPSTGWLVREYHCCGHVWQIVEYWRFPERKHWFPTCPDCGKQGWEIGS